MGEGNDLNPSSDDLPEKPADDRQDEDEWDLESPLSIEETEELRKIRTGKPLEEILRRLGL